MPNRPGTSACSADVPGQLLVKRSAQAELAGACRPRTPALALENALGDGDLLAAAGLVRRTLATERPPGRRRELQATGEAVTGVRGPVAAGLAHGELVPDAGRSGVGGTCHRERASDRNCAGDGETDKILGHGRAEAGSHSSDFSINRGRSGGDR